MDANQKIIEEIEANKNNSYVKVVGEFLLDVLKKQPESAKQILDKDKTILKSLVEMRKVAFKKKVGNCAVLTDQEGFDVILKYYCINKEFKEKSNKNTDSIDISLEDLL